MPTQRILLSVLALMTVASLPTVHGAEVTGQVAMPEVCSPGVSPAVVTLEPTDRSQAPARSGAPAELVLIDQQGLQFVPRIQAMPLGQTLRFTNADSERHSIHVQTAGFDFNQSMAPGEPRDWIPEKAGVIRLACDIHPHMRGYVVVSPSPWVKVCTREGQFRFKDVPAGRYVLRVWHEMGEPLERPVTISGETINLGVLTLTAPVVAAGPRREAPVRTWPEVIDRISVTLAASLDAATRPGEFKKARRLAEDAYWGEFEASDMERAVRSHLGYARAGEIEAQFRAICADLKKIEQKSEQPAHMAELTRKLLLELVRASDDLKRKGVSDRLHVFEATAPTASTSAPVATTAELAGDREQLSALKRGLLGVQELADRDKPDDAASAMTSVYWTDFEPLERSLEKRKPQEIRPLEDRFNLIRGEVGSGLKGTELAAELARLHDQVEAAIGRMEAQPAGTFAPAFGASLITILREGVEVILLLTMLAALAAKTGQAGAMRAIRWGVGLAVVASIVTAVGLNLLVSSAQGQTREIAEGVIMLAAAGVLFYVSYWLISQVESKRWMDFLKRQASRGAELGGLSTLALTAFLAVYREGAETALMYQAMIGGQGQTRAGLLGLAAGLGVGVVLLAVIALIIRAGSVRLPLRAFFKVTGAVLFAMAVVFAGNGIYELQAAGILRQTAAMRWLGGGVPMLGVYPTVQTLSVQGLLVAGAVAALVLILTDSAEVPANRPAKEPQVGSPAGVV